MTSVDGFQPDREADEVRHHARGADLLVASEVPAHIAAAWTASDSNPPRLTACLTSRRSAMNRSVSL